MAKTHNCGHTVYKWCKSTFEGLVDDRAEDVAPKLQDKGILSLSEEEKRTLLNSNVPKTERKAVIQSIKKAMREKVESVSEGEDNFHKILEVFNSLSGVDLTNVAQQFEIEKVKAFTHRRSSLDSQRDAAKRQQQTTLAGQKTVSESDIASVNLSTNPSKSTSSKSGQRKKANTISNPAQKSETDGAQKTTRSKSFDSGSKLGSQYTPLEPIPGSPKTIAKYTRNKMPFNRHASSERPAEPELDSTSYQQAVPEYTIISPSNNSAEKASHPTSRRLPVGQWRAPSEDVYDEMGVIAELDKLLEKISEEKYVNVDEYKTQFSVVMNLHKRLTDTYQQEKEQLKEDMQRIDQQAKEETEYLLKENKALTENDLVKRVEDKEKEIRGLKAEQDSLKAKLEKATNELNELHVENKQIVVKKIFDQLRECESLLGTPIAIAKILAIIRQKLSMLRKRPYTA